MGHLVKSVQFNPSILYQSIHQSIHRANTTFKAVEMPLQPSYHNYKSLLSIVTLNDGTE